MSPARKAIIALVLANVIWGAAAVVYKIALRNIPPMTFAFLRFFIGAIVLFIVLAIQKKPVHIDRQDMPGILINAFSGITLNIITFFYGVMLTTAIDATVIITAQPIFTIIMAVLLLRENVSIRKLFGVLVGLSGVILIILEPILHRSQTASIDGNLLIVIAAVGAIVGTLSGRKLLTKYDATVFTAVTFLIGSIPFLPLMFAEFAKNPHWIELLDWRGYCGLFYGIFLSGIAGYGLLNYSLSVMNASDTVIFAYLDPIVGTVTGVFMLGEKITSLFIAGAVLIFAGISVAEGKIRYQLKHNVRKRQETGDK